VKKAVVNRKVGRGELKVESKCFNSREGDGASKGRLSSWDDGECLSNSQRGASGLLLWCNSVAEEVGFEVSGGAACGKAGGGRALDALRRAIKAWQGRSRKRQHERQARQARQAYMHGCRVYTLASAYLEPASKTTDIHPRSCRALTSLPLTKMPDNWVLQLPQANAPEQPVLLQITAKGDSNVDLDLLATDGNAAYRGKSTACQSFGLLEEANVL